jgi:hypothetical protein
VEERLTPASQPVSHGTSSGHDIEKEIISPINDMFILHDSEGLEDDTLEALELYEPVRNFIEGRRAQPDVQDQLHAIWYVPHTVRAQSPVNHIIFLFSCPKGYVVRCTT